MRIVVCWTTISGYMAACWRALAQVDGVELFIIARRAGGVISAFDDRLMDGIDAELLDQEETLDPDRLASLVADRKPDVVVLSGWHLHALRSLAFDRRLRHARFIMTMDTPWTGSWKQRLGRWRHPRYFRCIDRVFVTGERCHHLARMLGFTEGQIHRGVYGVDVDALGPQLDERRQRAEGWPRCFVTAGQFIERKGVPKILAAHAAYAADVSDPWPLTFCGSGPLKDMIEAAPFVENRGFVQPDQMQTVFGEHGVFLMASWFDPWPLSIVEACASGLPILCTEACSSHVELVRPFFNGLTVATGDAEALARGMRWMHDNWSDLPLMGERSQQLAAPYSAQMWAKRWRAVCQDLLDRGA